MSHKFDPAHKDKLKAEWRIKAIPPVQTLQRLGLVAEDSVADIGCGIGFFAIPAAKIVDSLNIIYALDTSVEMLAEVEKRMREEELSNVIPIKSEEYNFKLSSESVSFALLVTVLHEIENKERFLQEARRILKPAGRIAIIDWEKKPTEMGPPLNHRLSLEEVEELLMMTDFEVNQEHHFTEAFYGLVAVKK
ncbi:class I SAM-dependent methyltransferase [Desulfitobacterium metallireducens]|uniref:Methyltransferase n=1 Tax=Desulfitobacterium metallireducens DSM 15288 TaxID=871968 RepID=W0EBZ6_9FIRM|nr:methyltransferase domain-containing protein [Desulfitobacterium metallireducens]AHF06596.1 methyltransferase [Desulfitobacterium metallireducens DSM 15288]